MAALSTRTPSPPPQMALPTFILLAFLLLLSFAASLLLLRRRRRPVKDREPPTPAAVEMEIVASGESGEKAESLNGSEFDTSEECERGEGEEEVKAARKKRRRGKKKGRADGRKGEGLAAAGAKVAGEWLYPFTSSSSAVQRRIKQQYDQLVKSNDDKALTLAQVGQFANILIDVKNDLENKSEIIQRKFTITKALLLKADRSSFDRLCQQTYRLEAEQKRLEEDTLVYNRLQEQLKLSPAYKKLLEIALKMESQAESCLLEECTDSEVSDISFEELLAQEKKDSFWQKNGKLISSSR